LFLCGLIATRVLFRSRYLYDVDSVNFALGLRRFDPAAHQPQPPGYFLYILLGRMAGMLFHDANSALVAISIAATCGALIAIYMLANDWFGRPSALLAGLIFFFSPLGWFHGTVALTYEVEAFFSGITGWFCWRILSGAENLVVPAALIAGIATGFRPSFLLFLGPLLLLSLTAVSRRRAFAGLAVLALTLIGWGAPMVWQSGGAGAYWTALLSLWRIAPARQTVFNSPPGVSIARLVSIAGIYFLCFGCAALLTLRLPKIWSLHPSRKMFTWVWVAPGLLFFTFIFLKFVNSGYLLVIAPPIFVWLGLCAAQWHASLQFGKRTKIAIVSAFAAVNTLVFLYAPVYCSWTAMRQFEAELRSVVNSLPQVASPADAFIVGFDSHFLGYRHAGYYLPGWMVVQYPEVRLASGMRVFEMGQRDTHLDDRIPTGRFQHFILFPLPNEEGEYRDYMAKVRARFPEGSLTLVSAGGHDFYMGSITDLALLFPDAAHRVYTAGDTSVNGR
jgi:hypothetical protein